MYFAVAAAPTGLLSLVGVAMAVVQQPQMVSPSVKQLAK
jgi:hypothetical protein